MGFTLVMYVVVGGAFGAYCWWAARWPKLEVLLVAAGLIVFSPALLLVLATTFSSDIGLANDAQTEMQIAMIVLAVGWVLIRGRRVGSVPSLAVVIVPVVGAALSTVLLLSHLRLGALILIALVQSALLGVFALITRDRAPSVQTASPEIEPEPEPERAAPPPPRRSEPSSRPTRAATKIFISYRRDDSADVTGRIYDRLVQRFGRDQIFKDVDSIPLGVDFRKHLHQTVGSCNILVAIIGDRWLAGTASGSRRIDDPKDFVRIELEAALQRDIPVIPLLVRGAEVPVEAELPATLAPLSYRNGIAVRPDPDFHRDMDRLIEGLEAHVAGQA